jgi:hypothetical protein
MLKMRTSGIIFAVLVSFFLIAIYSVIEISGVPGGPGDSNLQYDCGQSCHYVDLGGVQSSGTISMNTNNSNPEVGNPVIVDVTVSSTEQASGEPISVFLLSELSFVESLPTESGWTIISDPHGGTSNSIEEPADSSGGATFQWILKAPLSPGSYTLYAREHHGDGTDVPYFNDFTTGITFDVFSSFKIIDTKLNVIIPEKVLQDESTTLIVELLDSENNEIENAHIELYTPITFGLLKIGENLTGSDGRIRVEHTFPYEGEIQILAKYRGSLELNASEVEVFVNVEPTWEYHEEGDDSLLQVIVIGTVLGIVWSVFLMVIVILFQINNSIKTVDDFMDLDEDKGG